MQIQSTRMARWFVALTIILSLFAAACGGDDETTDAGPDTASDATSDLEGDFLVSGSSTVFPIVQKQAEEFAAANPGVAIAVEGPGSGDGALKFCAGEVPVANASRLYKDEEIAACEEAGIELIEIRRGIDGISVITSPDNSVECVTFDELYALISEEATGFGTWDAANDLLADMGSGSSFPTDMELAIFGPGEESGTFDSFGEIVIESVAKGKTGLDTESREYVKTIRPDYTASPNDNVIIEGIGSGPATLGWVGYAFAQEAADAGNAKLLQVSKEEGGECVTPTPATIADASFPIARFLYTYVNADAAADDPAVAAFVDYMMSNAGLESVAAVGYVDLAEADQALAQAIWTERTTGRSWS